jgi:hypothetical protein
MIQSFAAANNAPSVFNAASLEASLKQHGFDSVMVTSAAITRLAFTARASQAQKVFAAAPDAIAYTPSRGTQDAKLIITVSPKSAPQILSLFPSDAVEYTDFFLSPLLSGETAAGQAEYLETIKAVYGPDAAAALAKSNFVFTFTAPGAVTQVMGPPFASIELKSATATVTVPLASLLSVSQPAVFTLTWN